MLDIDIKIDGRSVRPDQLASALERSMIEKVRNEVANKLQSVRDPETGRPPKITLQGSRLDDLKVQVEGSEAVVAEVKRRLSS